MPFHRFLIALAAIVALAPAMAQTPPPSDPAAGLAAAMERADRGDYTVALDAATRTGPVARDLILWRQARDGRGTFDQALAVLRRHPDWPGLELLRRRMEETLPDRIDTPGRARDVVDFFGPGQPATGQGVVALVEAYRTLDRDGDAQALSALAWVETSMTARAEDRLLALYPDVLRPLADARVEQMYWDGADQAVSRALTHGASAEARARIVARRAARAGRVADLLPDALKDDAGIAFETFRRRMSARSRDDAIDILLRQSVSKRTLGRPGEWARDRRDLTRRLMRAGTYDRAYALASSHWLDPDIGYAYSDLEWLSGYLSLRFLDQPERALAHFRRFAASVETPISLGLRATGSGARQRRSTAAPRRPRAMPSARGSRPASTVSWPPKSWARISTPRSRARGLSAAAGRHVPRDPGVRGGTSFAGGGPARPVRDVPHAFVGASRRARNRHAGAGHAGSGRAAYRAADRQARGAARHHPAPPYYPVIEVGVENNPVEEALALSIARRESEFDPGVSSGVGARGLMQLMPGTARDVARGLGLRYSAQRLFSDPSYNATLGTAYLAGLIDRFGDNPILVSAGYNAGPGRPSQWIGDRGDPRRADVDVIDWIEMIPFSETRNYVMRVAESIPVYRMRLGAEPATLAFTDMLKGR